MDAGFYSGYAGPAFDNVALTTTYVTQALLDTQAAIDTAIDLIEKSFNSTSSETFELKIEDNKGNEIESFTIEMEPIQTIEPIQTTEVGTIDINGGMQEPTIEPLIEMHGGGGNNETQESIVDSTVEQVESEIQSEIQSAEVTVESQGSSESQAENNQSESEPQQAQRSSDSGGSDSKSTSNKIESKEDKEQRKQEIATRVVTKILARMDNSPAAQAVQLVLMNSIGADVKSSAPRLQDANQWYEDKVLSDAQILDPSSAMISGAQDQLFTQMVNQQYKN